MTCLLYPILIYQSVNIVRLISILLLLSLRAHQIVSSKSSVPTAAKATTIITSSSRNSSGDDSNEYRSFYNFVLSVDGLSISTGDRTFVECIDIPKNVSLCNGIGYTKMRLPNLLDHDTVYEITQQSASWVPLLNLKCHPDTGRFLCSVFCPVCLEQKIYPCRSLCENVKSGCETRMILYGYPWPDMFDCRQFPKDNDMCIAASSSQLSSANDTFRTGKNQCKICDQSSATENILDSYCQSMIAMRVKLRKINTNTFTFKTMKMLKDSGTIFDDTFTIELSEKCCRSMLKPNWRVYFVIGNVGENRTFMPTLIVPWLTKRSKSFKKMVKMLKTLNCSDTYNLTHSVIVNSPPLMLQSYSTTERVNLLRIKQRQQFSNHTSERKRSDKLKKRQRKNTANTIEPVFDQIRREAK